MTDKDAGWLAASYTLMFLVACPVAGFLIRFGWRVFDWMWPVIHGSS